MGAARWRGHPFSLLLFLAEVLPKPLGDMGSSTRTRSPSPGPRGVRLVQVLFGRPRFLHAFFQGFLGFAKGEMLGRASSWCR